MQIVSRLGPRVTAVPLGPATERWPERLPHFAHPAQGLSYDLLERRRRRRGGGLAENFIKHPRA